MTTAASQSPSQAQRLEALKRSHGALITRVASVKARVEEAQRTLTQVQDEAKLEFGTSDLEALRALHRTNTEANEAKLVALHTALAAAETQLADIERQLAV